MRKVSPPEVKRYVGQRVALSLAPEAPGAPTVRGLLVGTIDAADGLVVILEPEGSPSGTRMTCHYHHILEISPADLSA